MSCFTTKRSPGQPGPYLDCCYPPLPGPAVFFDVKYSRNSGRSSTNRSTVPAVISQRALQRPRITGVFSVGATRTEIDRMGHVEFLKNSSTVYFPPGSSLSLDQVLRRNLPSGESNVEPPLIGTSDSSTGMDASRTTIAKRNQRKRFIADHSPWFVTSSGKCPFSRVKRIAIYPASLQTDRSCVELDRFGSLRIQPGGHFDRHPV